MPEHKKLPHLKSAALLGASSFGLLALLLVVMANSYLFYRAGPASEDTTTIIEHGAPLARVADQLIQQGLISPRASFYWTARISGAASEVRAGEYLIPAGASQADILQILKQGVVLQHKLTIPEGTTSYGVTVILQSNPRLTGEIDTIPGEGTLLPETYLYSRGDDRGKLLERMNNSTFLEGLWAGYDHSLPFSTLEEAVIIASMVEEETAVPEERTLIAAVFLNRLKLGMRLQSDPTVIYGLAKGEPLGHLLRQSELDKDTPFNTYIHYGLPPGPISNPGKAALDAVFNPAGADALYFVADGSGGHVFAATLEEHNQNVVKWRKFQSEQGKD